MEKWKTLKTEDVLKTRIFEIKSNLRENGNKKSEFYSIFSRDWAVVIPVTIRDGKRFITLVRQYRHGSDNMSVEFPCGNIEKDENAEEGAARELLEETGLSVPNLYLLGSLSPNPAIMTNTVYYFLAENPIKKSEQNLDENEEIDILELAEEDIIKSYMGEDSEAKSAIMMAGLPFYIRYLKNTKGISYF